MRAHTESETRVEAWKPVLDALDEKRRQRLVDLLGWQGCQPLTMEQRIRKWENELADSGASSLQQRIARLEVALEETITMLRRLHD